MNTGTIASRYAKALLKLTQETGNGQKVYAQVCSLADSFREVPQLEDYVLHHSEIPLETKFRLIAAALNVPLAKELERFVTLVADSGRLDCFDRMLRAFIVMYREASGIIAGTLVSACESDELVGKLETMLRERTGADVQIQARVNPDILGGFVLEVDGYRLDASVAAHIEKIRRALVERNNRIV